MTNKNIDLPSKRARIVMEVEKPLRRKFRTRNKLALVEILYFGLLLGIIIVSILHFFVEPHLISTAHAAEPGTLEYFCQTGIANGEIDPKALTANYRELCSK